MLSIFRSRRNTPPGLTTDMHSHLLAGLDDGVTSMEEAVAIILTLQKHGYRKAITTPHIIQDIYRNTPEGIGKGLQELKAVLSEQKISFEIEAAAEYYLDEEMTRKVDQQEHLLTFGNRHLLFETNMITEPYHLKDFIFKVTSSGFKPVLAHPERYAYMNLEKAEDLRDRGVLLQINILSLIGYYSPQVQKMAQKLIDQGWVDALGSDCHNLEQVQLIGLAQKKKYYQKALDLPLLNHSL